MLYTVKDGYRKFYDDELWSLLKLINKSTSARELSYLITSILLKASDDSYDRFNSLLGVLEASKLELYRDFKEFREAIHHPVEAPSVKEVS